MHKFDPFLRQYGTWMHEIADDFVDIMRKEASGIYDTVTDASSLAEWDEFLRFVDGPADFKTKYERYLELKRKACGLPPTKLH